MVWVSVKVSSGRILVLLSLPRQQGWPLPKDILRFRSSRVNVELAPSTSVAIHYGDHKSAPRRRFQHGNPFSHFTSLGQTYDVYQVYDWAGHRDVCYQMYITERKVRMVSNGHVQSTH